MARDTHDTAVESVLRVDSPTRYTVHENCLKWSPHATKDGPSRVCLVSVSCLSRVCLVSVPCLSRGGRHFVVVQCVCERTLSSMHLQMQESCTSMKVSTLTWISSTLTREHAIVVNFRSNVKTAA